MRAYVHGNLDAITQEPDGKLQLLGGRSFLSREYSLQHELQTGVVYELCIVNPTSTRQCCICKLVSVDSGKTKAVHIVNLAPGGIELLPIRSETLEPVRVVIQSHLVMARPLVFRIQNLKLDVFHG